MMSKLNEPDVSDVLAWMALRKERNHWARQLRKALEKKDPPESIQVLTSRVKAIETAMKKFELK